MYLRPAFVETDLDRIEALIRAHNFGVLVTPGTDGMTASHIPFAFERDGDTLTLFGHLAKPNAQSAHLDGGQALVIFSGPHAYIAPSWYKTQPAVPTWDYAAVHIHGTLEPVDDPVAMLDQMAQEDPGQFDLRTLPDRYRTAMFAGIRSFKLKATTIEAQWKMSQNRSEDDRKSVIQALTEQGNHAVAHAIAATLIRK